jgi:hypothetical protein
MRLDPGEKESAMSRSLRWALGIALVLVPACRLPSEPAGSVRVTGVVVERSGAPVWKAKVWVDSTATTFTDRLGQFAFLVPARGKPFTVVARDGYTPGMMYAVTCAGASEVPGNESRVMLKIVLNSCSPI